jgi:4-amino-4-deoxy-L-arabinose transferase-like glycosyltransferase
LLRISKLNISTNPQNQYYYGLIATLVIALGLFLNNIQPGFILTDGGIFSAIAYKLISGGTLYIDAWENKPPGIFYLIAVFYFVIPSKVYALYLMSGLFIIATSLVLYAITFNVFQSALKSSLFIALALQFIIYPNNIGDGLYTEIYGTFCILLSIYFWDIYNQKNQNKFAYLSWFTLGFSCWFKEPFFIVCIPLLIFYLRELENKGVIKYLLLSFFVPSFLILIILFINNSLQGFIEMLVYNFTYLESGEKISFDVKIRDLYNNLIVKNAIISITFLLLILRKVNSKNQFISKIIWISVLLLSLVFVFLSPYNFGHYYIVFFTLFFVVFIKIYEIGQQDFPIINLLITPILFISLYQLNKTNPLNLKFEFNLYKEDNITKHLKNANATSLFVDCVEEGGYYIKGNVLYKTSFPVALPVHFKDHFKGIHNRNKIWKDLSTQKPQFIIKNHTTSFFYWHLPHNGFYEKEYNVVDSSLNQLNQKIYLLRNKDY